MTERGTDIDFDFFEEPPTEEATARARPLRRGGSRPPVRPPAGLTPILRLVGLVALAIVVAVLLVFWVQSCRGEDKQDAYRDYLGDVRVVAAASTGIGGQLNRLLATRGVRPAELRETLAGLASQQQQRVAQMRRLEPPGRLREEHARGVEALALRASGLRGLRDSFAQAGAARRQAALSRRIAADAHRLLASDVVWADLFRKRTVAELRREDVDGVAVPASRFLTNLDLATPRGVTPILQRIRVASTGGRPTGKHGHGLVSVRALPSGTVLDEDAENTVQAGTDDFALEVTIENSGDAQEVQVPVTVTLQQRPRPITSRQVVDVTNPGQRKTVAFRDLTSGLTFGQRVPVRVTVARVRGEQFLENNSRTYQVIFSLTPP